jgi:CBS domain containing-hemolysin-like protein
LEVGFGINLWRKLTGILGFGCRRESAHPDIEQEIQHLIDAGEQQGLITEDEGEMIQSILSFRDTTAHEIMVPRTEAVAVSSDISIGNLLQLVIKEGHSRIPVHTGSMDNIIGILHVKDLLASWGQERVDLKGLLRTPHFVPETKKISQLLKELRDKQSHMAIVIDEYGGFAGLVTIEDIIEEIVGEIHDEHDTEEPRIVPTAEGDLLVDARLDIEVLAERLGVQIPEGNFESVGGFIINLLGRMPQPHETVAYAPLEMIIESADARKIRTVRVRLQNRPDGSQEIPASP